MRHCIADCARFRISVAQFIRQLSRQLKSVMFACLHMPKKTPEGDNSASLVLRFCDTSQPAQAARLRNAAHARRSLMLARISATTSAFGFAPCGPPWCRRTETAPASINCGARSIAPQVPVWFNSSRGAMLRAPFMERPPQSKREHLRRLVAGKNEWGEPLSAEDKARGFRGWHERGYLPHCDQPGLTQFVTFRLWDSMPASRKGEWEHLLAITRSDAPRSAAYALRSLMLARISATTSPFGFAPCGPP